MRMTLALTKRAGHPLIIVLSCLRVIPVSSDCGVQSSIGCAPSTRLFDGPFDRLVPRPATNDLAHSTKEKSNLQATAARRCTVPDPRG